MSSDDNDLIERLHAVAQGFEMPAAPPADDVLRGRRRVRRNRGLVAGAAAAAVAVVLGVTAAVGGQDPAGSDGLEPVERPGVVVGDVPVWYDARGLHRGDVVEQTPVELVVPEQPVGPEEVIPQRGALALVRSGAVYLDPATGEVWFHPWGGDPRVVGHNSAAGPGGDPNGDTAAWFEGSELVVYDPAAGREISRTEQRENLAAGCAGFRGDHYPPGNCFVQVSAERVVWTDGQVYSHDLATRKTSVLKAPKNLLLEDVHDHVEVFDERGSFSLVVRVPGQAEARYPELESQTRLSPSGSYVLAVEETETRHAAAIVDTRTGELWRGAQERLPLDRVVLRRHCPSRHRGCAARLRRRPPHMREPACRAPVPDADQLNCARGADGFHAHDSRRDRALRGS